MKSHAAQAVGMGPRRRGFTLIELLVVIAIIALLVSILLPSLNKAKELARKVTCATHLKQVHTSLLFYCEDNENWIPSAWTWWRDDVPSAWYGEPLFATSGMGKYASVDLFVGCPSEPDRKSKYYGINEALGAGGFGKATWPPKKASVQLDDVTTPTGIIGFSDGNPTKDSWVARPILVHMGGSFATERRYGWTRHSETPNIVFMDGHAEGLPYEDVDVLSKSDPSWGMWQY